MIAKKLVAAIVLAVAFAFALSGCSLLEDDHSSTPPEGSPAAIFGLPRLPAAQAVIDVSPSRAVEVLSNFAYREYEGTGQWAGDSQAFDLLDQAAGETAAAFSADEEPGPCWVMVLSAYEGGEWSNCTLDDLKSGADPDQATIVVFSGRSLAFENAQDAADFLDALFSSSRSIFAIGEDGLIADAVVKNTTGAVCHVTQEAPRTFCLTIHAQSNWQDGNYDGLVDECKKLAEAGGLACSEYVKVAPLFEDPRMEPAQ